MNTNIIIPINVDLITSCDEDQLYSYMVGGNPDLHLKAINNMKYKCLISLDNKYKFSFDESNKNMLNNSIYLGKGSNTAVISIVQNYGLETLNNSEFVIRITKEENKFNVEKYKTDKELVNKYIPTSYYYGILHCENGTKLNYVISQKCNIFNQKNIDSISYQNKQKFLIDLLSCLEMLQSHGYVLWDLKISNVGYTYDYDCVLIDYDENTILPSFIWSKTNTYYPTYIYINYLSFIKKYEKINFENAISLNKISVSGLADIILALFFIIKNNDVVQHATLSNLHHGGTYKSVYTNSSSSFHTFKNSANSHWWTEAFLNLVNGEKITEYLSLLSGDVLQSQFNNLLINILFDYQTFEGLLSPEYKKIPTFLKIKEKIEQEMQKETFEKRKKSEFDIYEMVGGNTDYKQKYLKYLYLNQKIKK